jgi:hypothetical protein
MIRCRSRYPCCRSLQSLAIQAQGVLGGVERGASDGGRAAGPVGAVVETAHFDPRSKRR